jgi:hypothetical protein
MIYKNITLEFSLFFFSLSLLHIFFSSFFSLLFSSLPFLLFLSLFPFFPLFSLSRTHLLLKKKMKSISLYSGRCLLVVGRLSHVHDTLIPPHDIFRPYVFKRKKRTCYMTPAAQVSSERVIKACCYPPNENMEQVNPLVEQVSHNVSPTNHQCCSKLDSTTHVCCQDKM